MTKALAFCIVTFCQAALADAQSLCEPFYVINETNKGNGWEAAFTNCIDARDPVIKAEDNPQLRARIIYSRKISKITSKQSTDSWSKAEHFDRRGYTVFIDSADNLPSRWFHRNTFTTRGLLAAASCHYASLAADSIPHDKGWMRVVERFKYDSAGRLIKLRGYTADNYKSTGCVWIRSGNRRHRYRLIPAISFYSRLTKYDSRGNIIKSGRGGYAFTYDSENRLIKAVDLTPHLVNAGTSVFAYDAQNLLTSITTTFDDKHSAFHSAKLEYDGEKRLVSYTLLQKGTTPYSSATFEYTSSLLTSIKTWLRPNNFATRRFHYNPEGLITKIEYYHNDQLLSWTDYSYAFFKSN